MSSCSIELERTTTAYSGKLHDSGEVLSDSDVEVLSDYEAVEAGQNGGIDWDGIVFFALSGTVMGIMTISFVLSGFRAPIPDIGLVVGGATISCACVFLWWINEDSRGFRRVVFFVAAMGMLTAAMGLFVVRQAQLAQQAQLRLPPGAFSFNLLHLKQQLNLHNCATYWVRARLLKNVSSSQWENILHMIYIVELS